MAATRSSPAEGAVRRLEAAEAAIGSPALEGDRVFTALFLESARREARASDARRAAGSPIGGLEGRLVSIKALLDVAGSVTNAGSALLRARPSASADAVAVARVRQAGAVILGKTQMTEFAFSAVGTNPHEPPPGNPHDRDRAPGGSSSGAAVSVVDGMAEIAIGSDTGGSIRIPAALCGAVGFKPTSGRVPTDGAFSLSSTLDTLGPIARNVADCAAADAVLSGAPQRQLRGPAADPGFRLVVARGRLFDGCEPEVLAAFSEGLDRLRAAGLRVVDGSLDAALDDLARLDSVGTFPPIELGATLRSLGITDLDGVDPNTRARIEAGAGVSAVDYVRMVRMRRAAIAGFEDACFENQVFLAPTTPIRAPRLADVSDPAAFQRINGLLLRNPRVANLLDCPSISLPLPVRGLPVGLMLVGRRGSDRRLLEIAARVEAALGAAD